MLRRTLFTLLLIFSGLLRAQVDLSELKGVFFVCEPSQFLGLHSQRVRPHHFTCPEASGYVMNETPVLDLTLSLTCQAMSLLTRVDTLKSCNTVKCLSNPAEIKKLIQKADPDCEYEIISMSLFEHYPLFKTSGPLTSEPFIETMPLNNEDDPDYLSRINGKHSSTSITTTPGALSSIPEKNIIVIDQSLKDKLCSLSSLEVLDKDTQDQYLKLSLAMYQDPDFEEEKLQRKLFCLLKKHYEKTEDYDHLLELIAKMKFQKEDCL